MQLKRLELKTLLSKLNASLRDKGLAERPFVLSLAIHFLALSAVAALVWIRPSTPVVETTKMRVVEKVTVIEKEKPVVVASVTPIREESTKPVQEVFGIRAQTHTQQSGTVEAKAGNVLTKEADDEILEDEEALPTPTQEFLVTDMPRVIEEVTPDYPSEIKRAGIQGRVIFDILIDEEGRVRQAQLLRGIDSRLDASAEAAILKFRFRPAKVDKQSVAIKIQYAIRFVLED
jgi:TonB family protein